MSQAPCPVEGCDKVYAQRAGLKFHIESGAHGFLGARDRSLLIELGARIGAGMPVAGLQLPQGVAIRG